MLDAAANTLGAWYPKRCGCRSAAAERAPLASADAPSGVSAEQMAELQILSTAKKPG